MSKAVFLSMINYDDNGENEMKETSVKPSGLALLPILVFLVLFIGTGVITNDFYAMPAVVGFLIALGVAFFQTKGKTFNEKITIVAKGVGDDNIITMCLIFLAAGAFSGAVSAAGGVDSTVNLGLSLLPPQIAVIGLFVIGCFISISMGTSMGTIAALAPIAAGISEKTDFSMAICIGAVVSGAMFGDNLSMISDTTIAAVKTQQFDRWGQDINIEAVPEILVNGKYLVTMESVENIEQMIDLIDYLLKKDNLPDAPQGKAQVTTKAK